LVIVK